MQAFDLRQGVSRRLEELGSPLHAEIAAGTTTGGHRPSRRLMAAEAADGGPRGAGTARSLLHSMILGVDESGPRPLSREEISDFGDIFTRHLILEE